MLLHELAAGQVVRSQPLPPLKMRQAKNGFNDFPGSNLDGPFHSLRSCGVYFLAAPPCYAIAIGEVWWRVLFRALGTLILLLTAASIRGSRWRCRHSFKPMESAILSNCSIYLPAVRSWIAQQNCQSELQWHWTVGRSAERQWLGGKTTVCWGFLSTRSWMQGKYPPWPSARMRWQPGWTYRN